ncbi:hypothetical protein O181_005384 [Austropuccinia psidii MF-1]|uniref:Peptide hydrolase n=1 Tax=Austropuccinia psidii MF-1 TaxID=1389203 RepID=A0A9Q3GFU2_9BASI|nr:hypothetical protein [Austropuccinia psidii MF-1]
MQRWLSELIQSLISKYSSNITVSKFKHEWGQNSLIARFQPHPNSNETDLIKTHTFVIGAHLDSTNLLPNLSAPGTDDDCPGTTLILEAFDVLLQQNWGPKPSQGAVEFMWYLAKEGGLLGSQQIQKEVKDFHETLNKQLLPKEAKSESNDDSAKAGSSPSTSTLKGNFSARFRFLSAGRPTLEFPLPFPAQVKKPSNLSEVLIPTFPDTKAAESIVALEQNQTTITIENEI